MCAVSCRSGFTCETEYNTPGIHTPSDSTIGSPLRRSRAYTVSPDTARLTASVYTHSTAIGTIANHVVWVPQRADTRHSSGKMAADTSASTPDEPTCAIGN